MLGKLLKYELKSYIKSFAPLYIAIVIMSFITGTFMRNSVYAYNAFTVNMSAIMIFLLFGLLVALGVFTIVISIQKFKKNLLDDEGYLMFTLPVKTSSLILSKFIGAMLFSLLSMLVGFLAFIMLAISVGDVNLIDIIMAMSDGFKEMMQDIEFGKLTIYITSLLFMEGAKFILTLYLSMSMGQLPVFNKYRTLASFISFFSINIFTSVIWTFIAEITNPQFYAGLNIDSETLVPMGVIFIGLFTELVILVALFIATVYILKNKLNLE